MQTDPYSILLGGCLTGQKPQPCGLAACERARRSNSLFRFRIVVHFET
jgi:hypothetical protein